MSTGTSLPPKIDEQLSSIGKHFAFSWLNGHSRIIEIEIEKGTAVVNEIQFEPRVEFCSLRGRCNE